MVAQTLSTRTRLALASMAHLALLAGCSGADPASTDPPASSDVDGGVGAGDSGSAVDGSAPPEVDAGADAARAPVLAAPVAALAKEVATRSPGTELAIAVEDLLTGEYAASNDEVRHVSASSPKAIWVAAAIAKSGALAVTPKARPIFEDSDNVASGEAIDLAGGINAVNVFYTSKAGMVDSAMSQWLGRMATNSPRKMGTDNYFTAKDAIAFLDRLESGKLLSPADTAQLGTWMTWSPRKGYGGWLGTKLPEAARATMKHKGGWLPPGCCGDDSEYNTLNEIGIIEVAPKHAYAIAILTRRGDDWNDKQAPWVERASCVIYRAVSGAPLDCDD